MKTALPIPTEFVQAEPEEWTEGGTKCFAITVLDLVGKPAPAAAEGDRIVLDARAYDGPRYDGVVSRVERTPLTSSSALVRLVAVSLLGGRRAA